MRPLLASRLVALLSSALIAQEQPTGVWLDSTPIEWNRPGIRLPRIPKDAETNITPDHCKVDKRPVSSQEERAVAIAGWLVFASLHGVDGVMVVGGAASEDGMCRPDPYQYLVFLRGRFAGTLAPRLMRARADGSINKVSYSGPTRIVANFSRYTGADPLCCPSRISEATFEVRQRSGKPIVVLIDVRTRPT
jgi:hypothetical protein